MIDKVVHFHLKDFVLEDGPVQRIVAKMRAKVADMTDDAIVEACVKAAREEGVADLYLLDKKFVIDALREKIQSTRQGIPRWISVESERKPPHNKDVLCRYVFSGDSEYFYAVLTYFAYGDNGYVTGPHFTGEGLHDMRVTHWMPLPEPPKEERSP